MLTTEEPIYVKIPILGNGNVGKTTLFNLFRKWTTSNKQFAYNNNDFLLIENIKYEKYSFNLQLWDNRGIKNYKKLRDVAMFEGASMGIVVYDVSDTSKKSYNDILNWVERLWQENADKKLPVLIIGNKIDLRNAKIPTLQLEDCNEIASKLSQECNCYIPHIEISALSRENCDKLLDTIFDTVILYQLSL